MALVEPEGSFPRFVGRFPSKIGGDSSLGRSDLHGPSGDHGWQTFVSEQRPEVRLTVSSGLVFSIAHIEGQPRPNVSPTEARRSIPTATRVLRRSRSVLESTSFAYNECAGFPRVYTQGHCHFTPLACHPASP